MAVYSIRDRFSGQILHTIEVGKRKIELYAPDLRGVDLSNLILNGADLAWANLAGVNLRGTKLREANLFHANLQNADASYCDFRSANLREANLDGTILYPSEMLDAKLFGATITPQTDVILATAAIPIAPFYRRVLLEDGSIIVLDNMRQYVT